MMRKAITMLLAVLMLITFVSCNDQKVTEAMREQATKDFVATANASGEYLLQYEVKGKHDLSQWKTVADDDLEKYTLQGIFMQFVGTEDITSAEGTVEIEDVSRKEEDSKIVYLVHVVAEGVKITYTENGEEKSLSLDYDMSMKSVMDLETEIEVEERIVKSFKLNGTEYHPIEWCTIMKNVEGEEDVTLTKAICDGIELDCAKVKELMMQQSAI